MDGEPESLRVLVENIIRTERPETVGDLVRLVKERRRNASWMDVVRTVEALRDEGWLEMELPALGIESFSDYFFLWSENVWFYLVLAASLATFLAVYVLPQTLPFIVVRWFFGTVYVLYLPGYALLQALFPGGLGSDGVLRFALSVGLSVAVAPLIGLLLNYTPWGIRLDPIVVGLSLFTLAMSFLGLYRRYVLMLRKGA